MRHVELQLLCTRKQKMSPISHFGESKGQTVQVYGLVTVVCISQSLDLQLHGLDWRTEFNFLPHEERLLMT